MASQGIGNLTFPILAPQGITPQRLSCPGEVNCQRSGPAAMLIGPGEVLCGRAHSNTPGVKALGRAILDEGQRFHDLEPQNMASQGEAIHGRGLELPQHGTLGMSGSVEARHGRGGNKFPGMVPDLAH